MKFNILFPLKSEPSGGGNQFLNALKRELQSRGAYTEDPWGSDIIIFNSFPFGHAHRLYKEVAAIRAKRGRTVTIVHRVDGPISVVRGSTRDHFTDASIANFNHHLADATIFQSDWSRQICMSLGIGKDQPYTTITNAPDSSKFRRTSRAPYSEGRFKVVASSWSANWRKGFDVYRYLDHTINTDEFDFTFVGNSPIEFKNMSHVPALNSEALGQLLQNNDAYLTASVDDPCSNALIEALHVGLPAIARRSGGHPELVGDGGILFDGNKDVWNAIRLCRERHSEVRAAIRSDDITEIATRYIDFCSSIARDGNDDKRTSSASYSLRLQLGLAKQRYYPGLIRAISKSAPVKESRFYGRVELLRDKAETGPLWSSTDARKWVDKVASRLPLFIDTLKHPSGSGYKYSVSGDLCPLATLGASVFASKLRYALSALDATEAIQLGDHIRSFQTPNGAIFDPWVHAKSKAGRVKEALRARSVNNIANIETIRAETRQSFAALACLNQRPTRPFSDIPTSKEDIIQYIRRLHWTRPWNAASHISHLVFFLEANRQWFQSASAMSAIDVLRFVEDEYRREDGAWYEKGATISKMQRVNGAMKMVTALDAARLEEIPNPEGLIDLALGSINEGHACNHFNVICVLHRCSKQSKHRSAEIKSYMLDRLNRYRDHYWPHHGGFSFFKDGANDYYYNARLTVGAAEPDIHGSILLTWGIVLISDFFGWSESLGLKAPIT